MGGCKVNRYVDILLAKEVPGKGHHALQFFEWAVLLYVLLSVAFMLCCWGKMVNPIPMLTGRAGIVAMTLALWAAYRRWPCRLTMMLRVTAQLVILGWWYPDTYELNRWMPNLDHIFATWEQAVFGCQPALLLSQQYSSPLLSEALAMGYVSYFPMIGTVAFYYFCQRYERFSYAAFVILGSFFVFYVIFVALPVVGPQFYYAAVGQEQIAQGIFPNLHDYFLTHQEALPPPGQEGGFFHYLLIVAHEAGERPTAAFPSSHMGICTILLWLAAETRCKKLFFTLLPLAVLMFFATFYIQAHYAIDAIAGVFTGTAFYFLMRWIHHKWGKKELSTKGTCTCG